ncbi:ParB/RepB/Spo0J family partition protein [Phaeovulum sp. NW3]|uniref:ParB/RepB/Spo0J family partition protein n=1 Tax=Phaeovulum sp. NW3 TaxID=2934933 RepID=UPI002020BA6C|nr:ParB/RepB/Spo0J family partition protein [Phaeovulum sp. NW3]MCL7466264.1 ParB/RepB/Spo0J family partition protein [Phaeovulum sp. NW3]
MAQVLSEMTAQAAVEIDTDQIASSAISCRLDVNEDLDILIESIRNFGQLLPVLLRNRVGPGTRYEVVYGRRRIAACRALGIKVRGYVRDMDDRQALIAQALENSARLERSSIE